LKWLAKFIRRYATNSQNVATRRNNCGDAIQPLKWLAKFIRRYATNSKHRYATQQLWCAIQPLKWLAKFIRRYATNSKTSLRDATIVVRDPAIEMAG
jgi:hypothetical protein